jgi:thiosulfate/3-mercaptopyruvate sulfurtransferase
MLRALGIEASVLDGGLDKWAAEGRAVEQGPPKGYSVTAFRAAPRSGLFVDRSAVLARLHDPSTVIVNALGPQFHRGLEPSRYGRPGRIPGSRNVPTATLVNAADKTLTSLGDAEAKFASEGITRDKNVICYCGGGISATIDLFMLAELGYDKLALYDASMGEWARDQALPIETD